MRLAVPATSANATRDSQMPIKNAKGGGKGGAATYHTNCAKPTTRGIETSESSTETTTVSTA